MKTYIADMAPNGEIVSYFLIADLPLIRKSKKNTDYLCVKMFDKTGSIEGRLWEIPSDLDVSQLRRCIVKVKGQVTEWQDQKQLSISKIRLVDENDDVDMADFFERSERDPEEMWSELMLIVDDVQNVHVKNLLFAVLRKHAKNYKNAPAAKSVHHAYIGGLLEHVLSMCHTSLSISEKYDLDQSLMVAACVLHDLGKVRELSYDFGFSYTIEGTLLGHISIGLMEVSSAIKELGDFPKELQIAILHLVASHHGLLEYGSPKIPLMKEAVAFHLVDMLDSKMAICDKAVKSGISPEGLTDWVKELGGPLYRIPQEA